MSDEAPLPEDTLLFDHQIAGHVHGSTKTRLGLLKHQDGSILKPLVRSDERTLREQKFYERIFQSDDCPPELIALRAFVPKYKGVWKTNINREGTVEVEYLKLDDLARVFRKPSIIDVKIGAKTYDPLASKEKVALETSKYPWSQQIGFRILGMRVSVCKLASPHGFKNTLSLQVFDTTEQKYRVYGKDYGLRQTPDTVLEGEFNIRSWFENQRLYAFYSSSLLLMYDAPNSDEAPGRVPRCAAKMIDFAHVFPTAERDCNYLMGLQSLMAFLYRIAKA
ncbi:inositol polyphosphate multikinase, putative [Ixodes scapularis]|uniref:Kinase n=1 Tax=Ixodes scapularis TaxID=6945 RepID=B7P880_IXOSC|nr:inositol polyphosphate multikinase, putative [Ixodes scapularis]|eukprot:XP_002401573.1 inositol polyphosphate multikinase, putative [Ixodes scapularis]